MLQNRLAPMTPVNCLAAVYNWLRNEEGLIPKSTNLVTEAGTLWMEFRELATAHDSDDSEPIAVLRALLTRRIPANAETKITDDVLCIDLHEHDPTPRVSFPQPGVKQTETLSPWRTIALFSTPYGVKVQNCRLPFRAWGEQIVWPFTD